MQAGLEHADANRNGAGTGEHGHGQWCKGNVVAFNAVGNGIFGNFAAAGFGIQQIEAGFHDHQTTGNAQIMNADTEEIKYVLTNEKENYQHTNHLKTSVAGLLVAAVCGIVLS